MAKTRVPLEGREMGRLPRNAAGPQAWNDGSSGISVSAHNNGHKADIS